MKNSRNSLVSRTKRKKIKHLSPLPPEVPPVTPIYHQDQEEDPGEGEEGGRAERRRSGEVGKRREKGERRGRRAPLQTRSPAVTWARGAMTCVGETENSRSRSNLNCAPVALVRPPLSSLPPCIPPFLPLSRSLSLYGFFIRLSAASTFHTYLKIPVYFLCLWNDREKKKPRQLLEKNTKVEPPVRKKYKSKGTCPENVEQKDKENSEKGEYIDEEEEESEKTIPINERYIKE